MPQATTDSIPAPITVAVVSWNTRELLRSCLRSLRSDHDAGQADVWVVDNASSDGSAEMVRTEFEWVTLIACDRNLGFGPAVNLVAQATQSEWLAIANADIELTAGSLKSLVRTGERLPGAGIIAPRLVLPDGRTQHSAYSFPTLGFTLAFNLGIPALSPRLAASMLLEGYWKGNRSRRVDWAIGAFLLLRRTAWNAIGGFDPQQWMYAEDLDLGWRLANAGWSTVFEPSATVRHHGAAATSQLWGDGRDARWQRSTYAWMLRRRGGLITRSYGLINTLGAAARTLVYLLPAGNRAATWRARRQVNFRWTRLHLSNLLASRSSLLDHR